MYKTKINIFQQNNGSPQRIGKLVNTIDVLQQQKSEICLSYNCNVNNQWFLHIFIKIRNL